jgi:spore coat polysaccharide biosynthesis protein SpsF
VTGTPQVLAILQARMSSTRLPGKVMADVLGRPMLVRQIERIRRASRLDALCVATSVDPGDDPIEKLCNSLSVDVVRGSLDDVLDRFYQAALRYRPMHVVRLTADCPLTDPTVVNEAIALHLADGFDYTSNTNPPTFPDGLDVEVFRFECLEQAAHEAQLRSEREHVTPFIRLQPERFRCGNLRNALNLSALRWTVDYAADLQFVREVYRLLYASNPDFDSKDVLELLARRPDLKDLNAGLERDEGYRKSVAAERRP